MDIIEIIAMAMVIVGNFLILFTLGCAVGLLTFNALNSASSYRRPFPIRLVVSGWLVFLFSFVGLVAMFLSDTDIEDLGFVFTMSLALAAVLVFLDFVLLSLGTVWSFRGRRL